MRELVFPTFFALLGLTLIAILAELVVYSDLVVNRGFRPSDVVEIAWLRALPMLGRAIPYSTLLGALIALGRMVADREILVIQASGISPQRLAAPVAMFAAAMTGAAVWITAVVAPRANEQVVERIEAGVRRSSGSPLRSGVVTQIGAWRIVAREVSHRGDRLRAVAVWVPSLRETVFAETAALAPTGPDGTRKIALSNGSVLRNGEDGPVYITFTEMDTALEAASDPAIHGALDRLQLGTLGDLARQIDAETDVRERRLLEAEWNRRIALPMATLCFGALAVPLALRPTRLSRSTGAITAVGVAVVYAGLLQLSNGLGQTDRFPVALAAWLPDLALLAASAVLIAVPRGLGARRRRWRSAVEDRARAGRTGRFVLARHLLMRFVETGLVSFVVMLVALVLGDVVDNLQWFAKYHSTLDEVMRFYAARVPLLASQVVPMTLLIAAALTVSLLGASGELIGMRACGISAVRISLPILAACAVVAIAYGAAVDRFVPHTAALANRIKHVEIKAQNTERVAVWLRDRDHLYQADRIDPLAGVAQGITIYELDSIGQPTARIDAESGRHVGEGTWHLAFPRRVEAGPTGARRSEAAPVVNFGDELVSEREGADLSVDELRDEIGALESRGFDATAYRVDLHAKLAAPLACLLLPALALVLATGGPPFRTPAQILLSSVAIVAAHFTLSAFCISLGYRGAISVFMAGWGETAVFAAGLAGLVIVRMRRSRVLRWR
jgi:lipopolysaccharide export system permease protein